ncbi:MAG: hypothetical protein HYZ75_18570 [Elusimicrobia bacterium]|nr:hypothetical protein [Elusimicrobiota bacterium]
MPRADVLLLNPAAGNGRAARRWEACRAAVEAALGPLEVLRTERRGHGPELVGRALEGGARRVFAFGGDGTWNEAVAGFLTAREDARTGAVLAPLPAGSGCDFARHLRLPLDPAAAAAVLAGAPTVRIDALRVEYQDGARRAVRHCTNMAGVGLAADSAALVERWGKPLGGTLSYLAAALAVIAVGAPRAYRLSVDGEDRSGRYHVVFAANTESTGGGMLAAPGADLADGRFELLSVDAAGRAALVARLVRLYSGRHVGMSGVFLRQARRVELALADGEPGPAGLNLDGECLGGLPAVVELVPGAVPVLVPARRES